MACKIIYKGISYDESDFKIQIERYVAINNLFNENETLANAVYEALGFNNTLNFIYDKRTGNLIDSVEKNKDICLFTQKATSTYLKNKNINSQPFILFKVQSPLTPNKIAHTLTIVKINDKIYFYDMPQSEFIKPTGNNIKQGTVNLVEGVFEKDYKPYLIEVNKENLINKYGISQNDVTTNLETAERASKRLFNNKIELSDITPQQKQEAQQLYSQYLDTVFPDSKVKDIVYNVNKTGIISSEDGRKFYSTSFGSWLEELEEMKGTRIPIILNITNPTILDSYYEFTDKAEKFRESGLGDEYVTPDEVRESGTDSVIGRDSGQGGNEKTYVTYSSNQVHQLGTKQDIKGFKEFVSTQPKQGPQPGEQLDLFNQRSINPNQKFDKELAKKIQDKLEKLYPEIKLNISNTPVWEEGNNVLNQEQYNNQVNYRIKTVDILLTPKADQVFAKGIKNKWALDKILTELQIPKNQKGLIEKVIETMPYFEGIPFNAQLAYAIASTYNYTIEINTAKTNINSGGAAVQELDDLYVPQLRETFYFSYRDGWFKEDSKQNRIIATPEELKIIEEFKNKDATQNSSFYSNLTVPGGTNYTENEIATPAITPSIKGHAQFATDQGIGWFRSDDKDIRRGVVKDGDLYFEEIEGIGMSEISKEEYENANIDKTKTRRILEVQSDLFQKGRDRNDLIDQFKSVGVEWKFNNLKKKWEIYKRPLNYSGETLFNSEEELLNYIENKNYTKKNQFLQLLNKDNNWVTFFIKSIIQDSAKKGYEKVLFPSGNTASKVEGHTTLEEFKKQKEDRIKELEKIPNSELYEWELTFKDKEREINQLKQELEKVEKEGFGALRPIYNFYENSVTNILKKQGYNPQLITDEYGNTWNEININQARDLANVLLQRNEANQIIGQANIKAMTVLIDAVNQKQDTLPHEYAHHYIAWFRNTPIVQEAIKKWGSEEALVQSIGEQVVKQKGDAYNWWNNFVKWIMNQFNSLSKLQKKELTQILTDAFLTRQDLGTKQDIEGFKRFVGQSSVATTNNLNAPEGLPGIPRTSTDCQ